MKYFKQLTIGLNKLSTDNVQLRNKVKVNYYTHINFSNNKY